MAFATTNADLPSRGASSRPTLRARLQDALPKIVLAPSFAIILVFVYGFILWTIYLSFTNSRAFPSNELTGGLAYQRLWNWTCESDPPSSWYTSITNMAIFGVLYVGFCMLLGRFVPMVVVLALAGLFAAQRRLAPGPGTLPTDKPLFVVLLTGVALVVVGLTFVPVLALGPVVESLS